MGSIIRLIVGVPVAVIVVGGLFLIMAGLIKSELNLDETKEPPRIEIGQQLKDRELTDTRKFDRPTLDEPPPPPPAIQRQNFQPSVEGVQAAPPSFDAETDIGTAFNPDRDAQPLVRVPPQGFERCLSDRGGDRETVTLEFDVTPQGTVTNVKVINSTDSCYNRYAVRSAEKWKYQPKIVDGEQAWRRGVRTNIVFQGAAE